MAVKKSELYRSLWAQCDSLRGGMDASQYKDYVLVLLFMKYVSDRADAGGGLIEVPEGCRYADLVALAGKPNVGEEVDVRVARVARANGLEGVIDLASFNDEEKLGKGKELVATVGALIREFDKPALNFRRNRAEDDDLLGDAYEYLMRNFATQSGKSKGQFYTPAEVSRVMARVIGLETARSGSQSVYDPTCGSGSLLMKAYDHAKQTAGVELSVFGQEMDNATYGLARMNAILHGNDTANVYKGNTLAAPADELTDGDAVKRFDFVVANPPFSWKRWTQGLTGDDGKTVEDPHGRFEGYATPPPRNGDYAFLLHVVASLKGTGTGCVVMPHGVLFRGNREAEIRRELVRKGYIKGVIGLPPNLFYGTGIPACLIVLDKRDAATRDSIFVVDAGRGFRKDGAKNRLRERDVHRIVDVFTTGDESDPRYARRVPIEEVERNGFNLNLPRYVDSSDPEDRHDVAAHLLGGVPDRDIDDLGRYWKVFPSLRADLFGPAGRDGYSELKPDPGTVRDAVLGHAEFAAFRDRVLHAFDEWAEGAGETLAGIDASTSPRELIGGLGESILAAFAGVPLVDPYAVFQHLTDYWTATMKDDVYLVIEGGWNAKPEAVAKPDKGPWPDGTLFVKEGKATGAYRSELIPKAVAVDVAFAADRDALRTLEADRDAALAARDELLEEHGGEDGPLAEVANEKGNVTKRALADRLRELRAFGDDEDAAAELAVLEELSRLETRVATLKKEGKAANADLDREVLGWLRGLGRDETLSVVVEAKWLAALRAAVAAEATAAGSMLAARVEELGTRYADPLGSLEERVGVLNEAVRGHLRTAYPGALT